MMALGCLPALPKDPFDRILVAQAIVERMPLVTKDGRLPQYGVATIRRSRGESRKYRLRQPDGHISQSSLNTIHVGKPLPHGRGSVTVAEPGRLGP